MVGISAMLNVESGEGEILLDFFQPCRASSVNDAIFPKIIRRCDTSISSVFIASIAFGVNAA